MFIAGVLKRGFVNFSGVCVCRPVATCGIRRQSFPKLLWPQIVVPRKRWLKHKLAPSRCILPSKPLKMATSLHECALESP